MVSRYLPWRAGEVGGLEPRNSRAAGHVRPHRWIGRSSARGGGGSARGHGVLEKLAEEVSRADLQPDQKLHNEEMEMR